MFDHVHVVHAPAPADPVPAVIRGRGTGRGCRLGERRTAHMVEVKATPEEGEAAYNLIVGLMVARIDRITLDGDFQKAMRLDGEQLIRLVQELQVRLFPAEFLEAGEYDRHQDGVIPPPSGKGVGHGRMVQAAGVFQTRYAEADSGELCRKLVADHKALVERQRRESVHAAARLQARPGHCSEGGFEKLAVKLAGGRKTMTPEAFARGGATAERIKKAVELWKVRGDYGPIATALNVNRKTVAADLKDAVGLGLLEPVSDKCGEPKRPPILPGSEMELRLKRVVDAWNKHGNARDVAKALDLTTDGANADLRECVKRGWLPAAVTPKGQKSKLPALPEHRRPTGQF